MAHRASELSKPARAAAGRLSWGLGDQAVSSLINFGVGLFVARSLGVTGFGVFTLAWVSHGVVLNLSRGLTSDPFVVRFSGVAAGSWRAAARGACGTALLVGVLAGALSALAGTGFVAAGLGDIGAAFLALAIVLPVLLLQDCWRFAFVASGRGRAAFANDVVRAAVMVPALLLAAADGSVFGFVVAWGAASAVASGYGCWQALALPSPRGAVGWLRGHRDLGVRYLVENVSNSGASQLRSYGVGGIAGLGAVGALRGAELLLGPFLAVLMGLSMVAVPEAARVLRRSPRGLRRFCVLLGGGQAVAALVWGMALLLALPDGVGRAVLGPVWAVAAPLILPVTLSVTGAGVVAGASAGLHALGAARRSMRSQLLASVLYLTCGLAGAAVAGAAGASWGSAAAMWVGAAVWWHQLRLAGQHPTTVDTVARPEEEEMTSS